MSWLKLLASPVMGLASNIVQRRAEKSAARHEATMENIKTKGDWERTGLNALAGTLKDEFVTVLMWVPFGTLFYGALSGNREMMDNVLLAFQYMEATPAWFQVLFGTVTAAAVGLRFKDSLITRKK